MPLYTNESKREWLTYDEKATIQEIQIGCLQRIAVALETMAQGWRNLEQTRDQYQCWYNEEREKVRHRDSQIRGLKGALTKARRGRE